MTYRLACFWVIGKLRWSFSVETLRFRDDVLLEVVGV